MESRTIHLPWPPSVNHYWLAHGKIRFIGKEGLAFRQCVKALVNTTVPLDGALTMVIEVTMPDNRRRDLDNLLKAPLDALQHAGMYNDDCQIEDLHIFKVGVAKPGGLKITITKRE